MSICLFKNLCLSLFICFFLTISFDSIKPHYPAFAVEEKENETEEEEALENLFVKEMPSVLPAILAEQQAAKPANN